MVTAASALGLAGAFFWPCPKAAAAVMRMPQRAAAGIRSFMSVQSTTPLALEDPGFAVLQALVGGGGRAQLERGAELPGVHRVVRKHVVMARNGHLGLDLRRQLGGFEMGEVVEAAVDAGDQDVGRMPRGGSQQVGVVGVAGDVDARAAASESEDVAHV